MPLELGLFLGARQFGVGRHKAKRCIILDRERYRYQKFISDIAGQDIHSYGTTAAGMIEEVSSWLRHETTLAPVPGGKAIAREFQAFQHNLPNICGAMQLAPEELTFQDYRKMAIEWIVQAARA
ncbi:MAG: hypothetical protein WCJ41_03140 [Aestuariivirga sp.]|uniref:hypothetical protein n=1 Tax=Aestuariivirga sp. TaxID=2650926 RepID=UPI00301A752C